MKNKPRNTWDNSGLMIALLSRGYRASSITIAHILGITRDLGQYKWQRGCYTREEMLMIGRALDLTRDEFVQAFFFGSEYHATEKIKSKA